MTTVKDLIRKARADKGLTGKQVADKAKVSQGYINRMEVGNLDCRVSEEILIDIAKVLDIDKRKLALAGGHLPKGSLEVVAEWMIERGHGKKELIEALEIFEK